MTTGTASSTSGSTRPASPEDDAGQQRGLPVDQQVDGQQQQQHRHPEVVAVDTGGDEQHRAGRHQRRGAGREMDRPPRHEHLEHQQRRGQVGDAGRQPGQQVERRAAGDGDGRHQQLHRGCGQRGEQHEPLERVEMCFRREALERSHGLVV
jgi:hypothetical protein